MVLVTTQCCWRFQQQLLLTIFRLISGVNQSRRECRLSYSEIIRDNTNTAYLHIMLLLVNSLLFLLQHFYSNCSCESITRLVLLLLLLLLQLFAFPNRILVPLKHEITLKSLLNPLVNLWRNLVNRSGFLLFLGEFTLHHLLRRIIFFIALLGRFLLLNYIEGRFQLFVMTSEAFSSI